MSLDILFDLGLKALAVLTLGLLVGKGLELWDILRLFSTPEPTEAGLAEWLERKERGLTLLATLASAAPFLGLAGTITHIIGALTALSGGGDIAVISGPIAQSLYATLWGLASAIPATIFYNLAQRRLQILENRWTRLLRCP